MIAQPASSPVVQPVETDAPPATTIDRILDLFQHLAPEQQQLVLDFVEFLAQKHTSQATVDPTPETQHAENQEPELTIWERFDQIMADVPDEEWAKIPTDGSYQHDHYLYGTPKREL